MIDVFSFAVRSGRVAKRPCIAGLLLFALLVSLVLIVPVNHAYAVVVAQGTSGTCTWTLDQSGVLLIAPNESDSNEEGAQAVGELGWWGDEAPWVSVSSGIASVKVEGR